MSCFLKLCLRLATCPGRGNKPTIVVTKDFKIYLGNFTDNTLEVEAGELFAFNTGSFEVKLVRGDWPEQNSARL